MSKQPMLWTLWHPHQGLWNRSLIKLTNKLIPISPLQSVVEMSIVQLDTMILFLRAIASRFSKLGLTGVFASRRVPDGMRVLHLDLGTHKEGAELSLLVNTILPSICDQYEAIGFEAGRASFEHVSEKLSGRNDVRIVHRALCHELPPDGKIKLYKDTEGGIGDSLYRETEVFETVDAGRLSDFLSENGIALDDRIFLLRMNIEGAEYDVIKDLVEHDLSQHIDGYFGMWDDVSKIDVQRDHEFRSFLRNNNIHSFPFNGRDLRWSLRKKCIAYHVRTQILSAAQRLSPKKQAVSPPKQRSAQRKSAELTSTS